MPELVTSAAPTAVADGGTLDEPLAAVSPALPTRKAAPWRGRKRVVAARSRFVAVRFTEAEYDQLTAAAERAGLPTGTYLRAVALGSPVPRAARRPTVERTNLARVLGELGRVGSNLNQLARVANTTGEVRQADSLKNIGDDIRAMRAALMKALGRGD